MVGGGPAGLTAAIALAAGGLATALIGKRPPHRDNRTTALLGGSVTALETLGVWELCAAQSAPLKIMRIVDDTGRLWRAPEVKFESGEIDLDAFGHNIANRDLIAALEQRAARAAEFAADRRRGQRGRAGRRRGDDHAQERPAIHRRACRRRRWPPLLVPRRRRYRQRRAHLQAGRADGDRAPLAAAPRHFDRIPHAERAVHFGAAAGIALESGVGARSLSRRRNRRARRRNACPGDRTRLAFDPRQDRTRTGPRPVSAQRRHRASVRRQPHCAWSARPRMSFRRSAPRASISACATPPPSANSPPRPNARAKILAAMNVLADFDTKRRSDVTTRRRRHRPVQPHSAHRLPAGAGLAWARTLHDRQDRPLAPAPSCARASPRHRHSRV